MKRLQKGIWHPFLFAAYAVIALLAYNAEAIRLTAGLRALGICVLAAGLLVLLFKLVLRESQKAAVAASLALGLFFSYGHVYNFLETASLGGFALGRHRLLAPLWAGLFLLGLGWVRRKRGDFQAITPALNGIAAIALIFPLLQLGLFGVRSYEASAKEQAGEESRLLQLPQGQPAPDIYYIILDGYSRDDMLARFYNLDNTPFLDSLVEMGFYVARCSQSNYAQTQLSLASSLNSNYVEALDDHYSNGNTSRVGLAELIKHSATRRALEALGYTTVAFETGFESTQLEDASLYLSPRVVQGVNDFENLFIRTTAGRLLAEGVTFLNLRPDWEARDQAQRERILFTLEKLQELPAQPGPKFVFAHIVAPHWPHVFGPDGEPVHEKPDSASGYRNQVIFLNKRMIPLLQAILSGSQTPPIIIIQGDHGAIIESPARRMSILNAYYLPDGGSQELYEEISPVNTFRVILNRYFGDQASLLPDTAYYSVYEDPFNFQIVPNERPGCQEN